MQIRTRFPEDRPDEVDLSAQVDEAATGSFSASFGYQGGAGVVGTISYTERNFDAIGLFTDGRWRGAGHTLGANVSWTAETTSLGLNFLTRRYMTVPYFYRIGFTRSESSDSSSRDWDETRMVSRTSIGRRFWDDDLELSAVIPIPISKLTMCLMMP